jgi:NAD(P)-dependent dehydrogenase (short-subunit alcohol dehydrogenase family)
MFEDLRGKNILIVGASRGVGKALAISLSQLGVNLHLASRNIEDLKKIQEQIPSEIYECDIDSEESLNNLAKSVNGIDGVCVISGFVKLIPPKMLSKKMVDAQVITNLAAPISLVGTLLRRGSLNDGCSIVFTSAAGRLCQPPCTAPYAGAKLGLLGAARSLAADLAPRKIRVNVASFDYVDTDMIKGVQTTTVDTIGISPVENSNIPYIFLLSSMSRWITGQIIAADAGRMLGKVRYA